MFMVTGGAGFIGSNLVAALAARGGEIAVCDRLDAPEKERNIAKHQVGELVAPEDLRGFLAGRENEIEALFHMGAISSTTATDLDLLDRTNVQLPTALWDWCAANGVPFIYASSAATYGDGGAGFDDDPAPAALARLKPLNDYGRSKHRFDLEVIRRVGAGEEAPPQWAGLKFFNVYGPNETHKGGQMSVVPQFYRQVTETGRARLFKSHHADYADGGQLRDFIWVGDCVDVMLWLLDNPEVSGLFNCGTGRARSFLDLATAVFQALGREPDIEFIPTPENIRANYQYFTEARVDRLRAAGYDKAFTTLEDGVGRYVRDHLSAADPYV